MPSLLAEMAAQIVKEGDSHNDLLLENADPDLFLFLCLSHVLGIYLRDDIRDPAGLAELQRCIHCLLVDTDVVGNHLDDIPYHRLGRDEGSVIDLVGVKLADMVFLDRFVEESFGMVVGKVGMTGSGKAVGEGIVAPVVVEGDYSLRKRVWPMH
jgi:hypothetical protein